MANHDSNSLRNVAIAGHGGTGKTSLCESFLFLSGKSDKSGRVDDGTSSLDFEPEEQKRRISISSAVNFFEWNKHRVNIIDTPGDSNFFMDTKYSLRVADSVVVVVDAVGGVEFQTEKVWGYADELSLPRMIYISKMDRERADFSKTAADITSKLGKKATLCYLPIGAEESFKGLIDLVNMKALLFDDPKGKPKKEDIPEDLLEGATAARETMVEDIAECDEALMDKYLEEGELSIDDIRNGLRKGLISGDLIPVVCGSALTNTGIAPLMDAIVNFLPSPLDRGAVTGTKPNTEETEERSPDVKAPFSAMVFKTIADPYAGKLTLFRVFSGTVTSDFVFYNSSKDLSEKCGNIFSLEGKTQVPVESLIPGDIAALAKLKETSTGDTMCDPKAPIVYERVPLINPIVHYAVEAKTKGDEEKVHSSLNRLIDEDQTLAIHRDPQTGETILSGVGQVHIDITIEKLKRKFGVDVNLQQPKVPYQETIKKKTRVQGKYKKQSGGKGQYGDTWLEIEPLPSGGGFEFVDAIVGGVVPKTYIPAVEKGIVEAMTEGILAGYPIVDVKVSLVDGSYHTVDSSEMAFKIAGSMGFKKGFQDCMPTLLEPIVEISIEIPDEYMGDVIGDLNSRRGRVLGMDKEGNNQVIKGQVPLAEILSYAPDLTSITSGRGTFSYTISRYEEVPAHLQEKVISEAKKEES
ncbi:MAG: elongation factor G [Deltaproteobacteria bacterium]|nr:elongation factor G [Deltaproteobacteria bacterium]